MCFSHCLATEVVMIHSTHPCIPYSALMVGGEYFSHVLIEISIYEQNFDSLLPYRVFICINSWQAIVCLSSLAHRLFYCYTLSILEEWQMCSFNTINTSITFFVWIFFIPVKFCASVLLIRSLLQHGKRPNKAMAIL